MDISMHSILEAIANFILKLLDVPTSTRYSTIIQNILEDQYKNSGYVESSTTSLNLLKGQQIDSNILNSTTKIINILNPRNINSNVLNLTTRPSYLLKPRLITTSNRQHIDTNSTIHVPPTKRPHLNIHSAIISDNISSAEKSGIHARLADSGIGSTTRSLIGSTTRSLIRSTTTSIQLTSNQNNFNSLTSNNGSLKYHNTSSNINSTAKFNVSDHLTRSPNILKHQKMNPQIHINSKNKIKHLLDMEYEALELEVKYFLIFLRDLVKLKKKDSLEFNGQNVIAPKSFYEYIHNPQIAFTFL
ncbi:hypothetical protein CEXT_67051 [Caerostris extrusa]|uniref:Uncharacterized protein n=1 Tax=Caerostris extrusa TaxID=172846 RepID=A0AAV4P0R2_CAEEX|nr:hypothetical protein CEXT_67051 [Caerostris extrusa]